jgi:hypothetical protein
MKRTQRLVGILTIAASIGCGSRRSMQKGPNPLAAPEEEDTFMANRHGATRATSPPCAADLASCGLDGCEDAGSPHALFNNIKRRATAADGSQVTFSASTPVGFDTLAKLQEKADQLVGQHVMPPKSERDKLAQIDVDGVTLGEGVGVRIAGYLAPHPKPSAGTHPGGVESVNCRLTAAEQKDIHIPFIPNVGDEECAGVVIEMIPQGRDQHPHWTAADLFDVGKSGVMVMFVGPLFYDSEHLVNDDCGNLKGGQPKRVSLWEVHPVTEVYKCAASSCKVDSSAGWTVLD